MSHGPFSGVNVALSIIAELEDQLKDARRIINDMTDLIEVAKECLGIVAHHNFTDRHGTADRLRAALKKAGA